MKKIEMIVSTLLLGLAAVLLAQTPGHPVKTPQKLPDDTLTVKVEKIQIGPEGIIIKDPHGKTLTIQQPSELDLKEIDSILESTGKTKIEIEGLKLKIQAKRDSILQELSQEGQNQGNLVRFGQSIHVEPNEQVQGDVVSIGGSIIVDGQVKGSSVALGGQVIVGNTGTVAGDAVAVGGQVIKHPGGKIGGEDVSLGFIPFPTFAFYRGAQLASVFLIFIISLFLGIVSYSLAPKNIGKIKNKAESKFFKSLFMGILGQVLILPVFLLLVVTVIGIPVALLILPLFLVFACVLGFTGISYYVGDKLRQNTRLATQTPLATILLGTAAIFSLMILWAFLDLTGTWFPYLGGLHIILLLLLAIAVLYLFGTVGFGAALLSRLGTRPKDLQPKPAITPPPATASSAPATA